MLAQRIARVIVSSFIFCTPVFSSARLLSSSITGNVRGGNESLAQAPPFQRSTKPTGTIFAPYRLTQGVYSLVNLIPGGPYTN